MNIQEIKQAVDRGDPVHWSSSLYIVIKDSIGKYLIVCTSNDHMIGLTSLDGKTLNGKESEFYIEGAI